MRTEANPAFDNLVRFGAWYARVHEWTAMGRRAFLSV